MNPSLLLGCLMEQNKVYVMACWLISVLELLLLVWKIIIGGYRMETGCEFFFFFFSPSCLAFGLKLDFVLLGYKNRLTRTLFSPKQVCVIPEHSRPSSNKACASEGCDWCEMCCTAWKTLSKQCFTFRPHRLCPACALREVFTVFCSIIKSKEASNRLYFLLFVYDLWW